MAITHRAAEQVETRRDITTSNKHKRVSLYMPSVATLHRLCYAAIIHLKWVVVHRQDTPLPLPTEPRPNPPLGLDFLKTHPDSYMHVKTGFRPRSPKINLLELETSVNILLRDRRPEAEQSSHQIEHLSLWSKNITQTVF